MVGPCSAWTGKSFNGSIKYSQESSYTVLIYKLLCAGQPRVRHFRSADDCVHDQTMELFKDATARSEGIWRKLAGLL